MAGKIFINYRRAANLKDAQLLQAALVQQFGKARVFLDVSGLDGGDHWLHTLEKQVEQSVAMVTLIGKGWADVTDDKGNRRLDNPNDFVRFEIARAFARNIPVLPVLVDGATMPDIAQLPANLIPLTFPQAMILRAESFDDDGDKIARRLKQLIATNHPRGVSLVRAGLVSLAALGIGVAIGPTLWSLASLSKDTTTLQAALRDAQREAADANAQASRAEKARQQALDKLAQSEQKVRTSETKTASISGIRETTEQKPVDANAKVGEVPRLPRVGDPPFRDCPNCPDMVVVPKGEFLMGSTKESDPDRDEDEGQRHNVSISAPFAVSRTHVTRDEFAAFVRASSYKSEGGCSTWTGTEWKADPARSWSSPSFQQDGRHPVVCVNHGDAQAYIKWISDRSGKPYRLLTEAEAEYIARGVTRIAAQPSYFFGNDAKDLCKYANSADEATRARFPTWTTTPCRDGYDYTAPVQSFRPNAFGLYDVHGNAWIWTDDCWNPSYNSGAPDDGSAWKSGDCERRVVRGGSWVSDPKLLRAATRSRFVSERRFAGLGFRVARTLGP